MPKSILVIDDDAAVRGAFSLILEYAGYNVSVAKNGLDGIEMAKNNRPDLIFLDLRMPDIDGVETLRRLKKVDAELNIYIVTAFANEYMEQLKVAHDEGLVFQLTSKPLSSAQIRHIASSIQPITEQEKKQKKLMLTLYIVSLNDEFKQFIEELTKILSATYSAENWKLEVVEVLHMPEKALANEIFATPMLVRNLPEPVLKVLGNLSRMPSIIAAITSEHANGSDTIVL